MKHCFKLLAATAALIFAGGCTSTYTVKTFDQLPTAEQKDLCRDWYKRVASTKKISYYTWGGYSNAPYTSISTSSAMTLDAANAGAALREMNYKRSIRNLRFCSSRYLAADLPEGYSTFFMASGDKAVVVPTRVDELNIQAVHLALDGKYTDALNVAKQAAAIQPNSYTSEIQGIAYLLAATAEKSSHAKQQLYKNAAANLGKTDWAVGDFGTRERTTYQDHKFLLSYAQYMSRQNLNDTFAFVSWDGHYFDNESHIYNALVQCTYPRELEKVDINRCTKEYKKYGKRCEGAAHIDRAKDTLDKPDSYTSSRAWLSEAVERVGNICKGDETEAKRLSDRPLELPATSLLKYLSQVDYRGISPSR